MKLIIEEFFLNYEKRFNRAIKSGDINVEEAASAFADYFIESSPRGVICGKNDEKFIEMIPKGFEHYKKIGTTSMKILSMDIQKIDDLHYMVNVHWDSQYSKNEKNVSIDFTVIYILTIETGKPKIFAYITGDEEKVLKQKGIL